MKILENQKNNYTAVEWDLTAKRPELLDKLKSDLLMFVKVLSFPNCGVMSAMPLTQN